MKTYTFAVPCSYTYEIEASSEDEARDILLEKGGYDIGGELQVDDTNYKYATLLSIYEDKVA